MTSVTDNGLSKRYQNYLFNFSSSYNGGGLKRLLAFIKWFNSNGGAHFIVHNNLRKKLDHSDKNHFHFVGISRFKKTINDQKYVYEIIEKMGVCDFYYSYNIPVKRIPANKRWFHLSNVLPLVSTSKFNIPRVRRLELWWLGVLTRACLKNCDFVSAESFFSGDILNLDNSAKFHVSINGSDEELKAISFNKPRIPKENIAVVVGTYHHKNLEDSFKIFSKLRTQNRELKLLIFGETLSIPEFIMRDPDVKVFGVTNHNEVINFLSRAKFYINTSRIENSWNAAAEGLYLAEESFISKIPPHEELLQGIKFDELTDFGTYDSILWTSQKNLITLKLESWDQVITSMNQFKEDN